MQPNEFNFTIGTVLTSDLDLFFGPDETVTHLPATTTWPDVLVTCGVFSSKGQARKAGWEGTIPEGFSDQRIGKRKVRVTILKITVDNNSEK